MPFKRIWIQLQGKNELLWVFCSKIVYDEEVGRVYTFVFLMLPLFLQARVEPFDDLAESFKNKVIQGEPLVLNGVATHRRFIFDIYELALYLKTSTKNIDEIIYSKEIKYARMKFLRDLSAEDIRDGFSDTFRENCLDKCENLKPQMDELLSSIPAMQKGELIEFTFLTDKTLISGSHQKSLEFAGVEFGQLFLRAWVGNEPPSERFKRELLSAP